MKKLIVITITLFLILLSVKFSRGQDLFPNTKVGSFLERSGVNKKYVLKTAAGCVSLFVAGSFDATREIIRHDYSQFKAVFPKASDQWCNPKLSHSNKWKGGNSSNGAKFPGSTTAFVFVTDLEHFAAMGRNAFIGTTILLSIGGKVKWYIYIVQGVLNFACFSAGFNLWYHKIYAHKY